MGISGVPHPQQHISNLPTVATLYIHVLSPQSKDGITCYTAATECTAALTVWVLALSWSAGAPPQTPHSSDQCESMTLCLLNTHTHTHTHTVGDMLAQNATFQRTVSCTQRETQGTALYAAYECHVITCMYIYLFLHCHQRVLPHTQLLCSGHTCGVGDTLNNK